MLDGPAAPSEPVRVAVVSSSPAVRSGIRALIDGRDRIVVVDEWLEPLADAGGEAADVLVGEAEDGALADWRAAAEHYGIVLLGERELLLRYRRLLDRPLALLLRESDGAEIAAAVVAISRGLAVAEPSLFRQALSSEEVVLDSPIRPSPLTAREVEVLRLVAMGMPNKAIAPALGISEHTVKFHIGSLMGKLDASSRTEAVTLAVRQGLLPL